MRKRLKKITNNNVHLAFIFTGLQGFGRGVWMGNILSLYIVLIAERSEPLFGLAPNELLGITSGITGIAMTALVFPSGFLADKYKREVMLKAASWIGSAAMLLLFLAGSIYAIFTAMFLWGAFQGLSRPAFESIFADSVASGKRSGIYAKIHLTDQIAMAIGPFMNVGLFFILGDEWDITILRNIMYFGLSFSLLSALILNFFKDDRSLGDESESTFADTGDENPERSSNGKAKKIAFLLVGSNLIVGMGAGMTVKFFPVFFRAVYGMKPIAVQLIMGTTLIMTGLFGLIAQKFSEKKGRVEIMLAVKLLATLFLFTIAFYPPLIVLLPLFVLRGSLMNSAQPLSRSILMDTVPKKHRGKWNSVETISWGLFWNASAVLGGFLIGDNNFRLCFLVTAGIYLVGTIPVMLLIPLVNKENTDRSNI